MNHVPNRRGKRADVLRGAQQVFSERGYEGATMDAIAAAAHVSKRTLYHHFGSKEELLQTIVADFLSAQDRGEPPVFSAETDLRADLIRFARIEMYLIDTPEHRGISRLLTTTFLHDPGFGVRTHGQHQPHAAFITWVKAARDEGKLLVEDPTLAVRMFYGLVEGAITWPALITDGTSLQGVDIVLREIAELFLARHGT